MLVERLKSNKTLRRICGWEYPYQVPDESTFSRAYAEFSDSCLPERVHAALIQTSYAGEIVGHGSRDSTAISAREKPAKKEPKTKAPAKRGRPKKEEKRPKAMTRLERQATGMSLSAMLDDLPKVCDVGTKRNSKGHQTSWIGYKLHIDAAENKVCATIHLQPAEAVRYNECSTVERVNACLKDEFGGRFVRGRGHAKVMCHLMFGVLALTADQFMRMLQ